MGLHLSALVGRGPGDAVAAARLGLPLVGAGPFVIVPLELEHAEAWARRLRLNNRSLSELPPDGPVTQHFAAELGLVRFALIHTDEGAGPEAQWATVYHGAERTMPVRAGLTAINEALERIGVMPDAGRDAFDTIGLGGMRHAGLYLEGDSATASG